MFNYYILVNIAILTGIGICLKDNNNLLILPSLLLLFLNNIFKSIDDRTVFLIKNVEDSIKQFELENLDLNKRVFNNEDNKSRSSEIKSYSKVFREMYNLTDFISIISIGYGVWVLFV